LQILKPKIMKKIIFFIVLLLGILSCRTTKIATEISTPAPVSGAIITPTNFSDPTTWLLGYFDPEQLRETPYSTWNNKGFSEYSYNEEVLEKLREINTGDLNIKIVMGTWCPDSRREVPRFMRVLDGWDFPVSKVKFIGVDDRKLSPVGEYDKLGILRVPTFIIYKNNIEAGRIIENPTTSLEQDILNILKKDK
jgi:thiol-disulfide isomerase/thioredoxin